MAGHPPETWHTLASDAVCSLLGTSPSGLSGADASARLARHGPNELREGRRGSPWRLLLSQFQNVLIVILLVGCLLSLLLGHLVESATIGVIVLLAVLLGFLQESRAERAMATLQAMAAPDAEVGYRQ